jgi:hypothetical protein
MVVLSKMEITDNKVMLPKMVGDMQEYLPMP